MLGCHTVIACLEVSSFPMNLLKEMSKVMLKAPVLGCLSRRNLALSNKKQFNYWPFSNSLIFHYYCVF